MSLASQIAVGENCLEKISRHIPNVPCEELLVTRMLVMLGRRLSAMAEQRLRATGLSEPEYHTLLITFAFGRDSEMTYPSELGTALNQSPANMTRLIDTLVQRGLLHRQPDTQDRRRLGLRITTEGEALVYSYAPRSYEALRATYEALPAGNTHELLTILKRLAQILDNRCEDACPELT